MSATWGTCRVCKEMDEHARLIKYGARHYAHPKCGLAKWGCGFFDRLPLFKLERFPYMVAVKAGCDKRLVEMIENSRAVSAAQEQSKRNCL